MMTIGCSFRNRSGERVARKTVCSPVPRLAAHLAPLIRRQVVHRYYRLKAYTFICCRRVLQLGERGSHASLYDVQALSQCDLPSPEFSSPTSVKALAPFAVSLEGIPSSPDLWEGPRAYRVEKLALYSMNEVFFFFSGYPHEVPGVLGR